MRTHMKKGGKKADSLKTPPCPFCGCIVRVKHYMNCDLETGEFYQGEWMECLGCGIQGPLKVWNKLSIL